MLFLNLDENHIFVPTMHKPDPTQVPPYYHYYIGLVKQDHLIEALDASAAETEALIASLTEEQGHSAYAPGKWTAHEVLRHIIDCERIFAYRALRFSRFDATPLNGFEEDDYILNAKEIPTSNAMTLADFRAVRASTRVLFEQMTEKMLDATGQANGLSVNVRGIGYMVVGHSLHHLKVIREKYLGQ